MMHPDSFELPKIAVISSSSPKARKEYVCSQCRELIKKGDNYFRQVFTEDRVIYTSRLCFSCCQNKVIS